MDCQVMRVVEFGPPASEYKRYGVGHGQEVFDRKGERLGRGPAGPRLDLACGTGLST